MAGAQSGHHDRLPQARSLRDWIAGETRLGNPALKSAAEKTNDPVLKQALAWSEEVNKTIEEMVFGVPPFPYVRESLEKISDSSFIKAIFKSLCIFSITLVYFVAVTMSRFHQYINPHPG